MLQVYVYGPTAEGFIDIDPASTLQMEEPAEAFDEDLSIGDYSLPMDIPLTDNTRKILGFPERIENLSSIPKSWRCIVYDDFFPELPNAKMTLLQKVGSFNYKKGKLSVAFSGNKGIFGSIIKNKKLKDLSLGGNINWAPGIESRKFAENLMKGSYPQYPYISFAPVAIQNFIDTNRSDYTDEFLARDTVNTVIISGGIGWTFDTPSDTGAPVLSFVPEHTHYQTVPFFKLKFVLNKIFEENGYTLHGDFINDAAFDDLVMFNNYGLEDYGPLNNDRNTFINPSNHMPDWLIIDFLKGLFSLFNIYPVFDISSVQLIYRKNNFKQKKIVSLTHVCGDQFDSVLQAPGTEPGYKLNYVWDGADGYYSDRVKDIKDKNLVATVATRANLSTLNIGRQLTIDDIAFVEAENLFYVVADATGTPVLWDVFAENLNGFTSGAGSRDVQCNISTLCTYAEQNATTQLFEKMNYVGTSQAGSYKNKKGIRVVNDFGFRIFYVKMQEINGVNVPTSFNYNRDRNNNLIEKYSLAWNGPDGIAQNFHFAWQSLLDRLEIIKINIFPDQKVLAEMAANNVYEINNIQFIPYNRERNIPTKKGVPMVVSVVPL